MRGVLQTLTKMDPLPWDAEVATDRSILSEKNFVTLLKLVRKTCVQEGLQ
jgi:hypothetical protein